jgi:DNA-binding PadR family transcriptional regulator
MGLRKSNPEADFLPGTLEMLVLKTLSRGANHGFGIAQHIQQVSSDALKIGEGSLYPALQRLLLNEFEKPTGESRRTIAVRDITRSRRQGGSTWPRSAAVSSFCCRPSLG